MKSKDEVSLRDLYELGLISNYLKKFDKDNKKQKKVTNFLDDVRQLKNSKNKQ